LTVTNAVTLSGSTANGVFYSNGSKVVTSGSALTFDGSTFTVTRASAYNARFAYDSPATYYTDIGYGGTNTVAPSNPFYYFSLGGSEQMRLTSTGLRIGTSSPAVKLDVNGNIRLAQNNYLQSGDGSSGWVELIKADSSNNTVINNNKNLPIIFSTDGEKMRLTTTGLGIGTSSVTSGSKLTVAGGNLNLTQSDSRFIGGDTAGRAIFTNSDVSTYIAMYGSSHSTVPYTMTFVTNSSNTLIFNSSGNLGLGVTPSAWASGTKAFDIGSGSALFNPGSSTLTWLMSNSYNNGTNFIYKNTGAAGYYSVGTAHSWHTAPSGTAGNAITFTQAMTLDASGYLLVGATSSAGVGANRLQVGSSGATAQFLLKSATGHSAWYAAGADIYQTWISGGFLAFGNAPADGSSFTERARIDSSGNFIVADTSSANVNANGGFYVNPNSQSTFTVTSHKSGTSSGTAYAYWYYNNSDIGSITQTGTTAVLYNTTSDQRLKENIADADSASSLIDALQVRKFDWKSDGSHQRYGFVAQELVTVAPEAVHQPADSEEMMAVDYSKLVPMLVKEIQSLRQRLSAANL
jgi:hypothetical protein